jgi:hypothetical protein
MALDKLEISITKSKDGSDPSFSAMSLDESKAFIILLETLTKITELSGDKESIKIEVRPGSLVAAAHGPAEDMAVIYEGFNEVSDFNSSDKELVGTWRLLQNLISKNGLTYEASFTSNNQKIDILPKFKQNRRFITKSYRPSPDFSLEFIKGKLIAAGGKSPNIHVEIDGVTTIINCKEYEAKRVNNLYETVYLTVWRKSRGVLKDSLTFCDHYNEVEHYKILKSFYQKERSLRELLKDLHYFVSDSISSKDFLQVRRILKLYNHEAFDANVLKTLLIVTKANKETHNVSDIRNLIVALLEKKRGSKLM